MKSCKQCRYFDTGFVGYATIGLCRKPVPPWIDELFIEGTLDELKLRQVASIDGAKCIAFGKRKER